MGLQSDALEVLGVAADFQTSKGFVVMDVLPHVVWQVVANRSGVWAAKKSCAYQLAVLPSVIGY